MTGAFSPAAAPGDVRKVLIVVALLLVALLVYRFTRKD